MARYRLRVLISPSGCLGDDNSMGVHNTFTSFCVVLLQNTSFVGGMVSYCNSPSYLLTGVCSLFVTAWFIFEGIFIIFRFTLNGVFTIWNSKTYPNTQTYWLVCWLVLSAWSILEGLFIISNSPDLTGVCLLFGRARFIMKGYVHHF